MRIARQLQCQKEKSFLNNVFALSHIRQDCLKHPSFGNVSEKSKADRKKGRSRPRHLTKAIYKKYRSPMSPGAPITHLSSVLRASSPWSAKHGRLLLPRAVRAVEASREPPKWNGASAIPAERMAPGERPPNSGVLRQWEASGSSRTTRYLASRESTSLFPPRMQSSSRRTRCR